MILWKDDMSDCIHWKEGKRKGYCCLLKRKVTDINCLSCLYYLQKDINKLTSMDYKQLMSVLNKEMRKDGMANRKIHKKQKQERMD
jgi:hypothetical protein